MIFLKSYSQNQVGLTSGNYIGVHNLLINPANICYQPISLDITLLSFDANLNNNQFYSAPTFLLTAPFNSGFKLVPQNRGFKESKVKEGNLVVKKNLVPNGYIFGGVNLLGPSVLLALSKKRSIALTTGFRTHLGVINVSNITANTVFEGLTFSEVLFQNMKMTDTKVSFASWLEGGISYAQVINENNKHLHRLGFSFKALFGIAGAYAYDRGINGLNENGKELIFNNSSFSYAYAGPGTSNNSDNNSAFKMRGLGFGMDIGYSIEKRNYGSTRYCPRMYGFSTLGIDYKWKAGISLLDIGAIKFNQNAFLTEIDNGSMRWPKFDTALTKDIVTIDSLFRSNITGSTPKTADAFWLILPSAISIQFDYHFTQEFFANITIYQRITLVQMPSLTRMNTIVLTPRFDSEICTVSMPIILNEYKNFNLGLSIRYKYLTIGSDRVGETFGINQAYGADFYTSFKYYLGQQSSKSKFKKGRLF
ncbi:MAG: hypothetical protein JHD28_06180 [Bacteroidia bacterium]|nr:hypothetical protein [Bacteroidia bacterium]